jgi:hypothetical protein
VIYDRGSDHGSRRGGIWRKRIILGLGGTLIVLLGVRGIWDLIEGRRLARMVESLEARWGSLDPASLERPDLPPGANRARYFRAASFVLDYDREEEAVIRGRGSTVRGQASRDPAAVAAVLERNQLPLQLVAEGASREGSNWEIRYASGFEARLPNLLDLIHLGRLVEAQAHLHIQAGRAEDALERIEQGYALASSLREEPILIVQVVGVSIERGMYDALRSLLSAETLTAGSMERLQAKIAGLPGREAFHEALQGEVMTMRLEVADILVGERSEVAEPRPFFPGAVWMWMVRPVVKKAHLFYLEEMSKVIESQSQPRHARREGSGEQDRETWPWYARWSSFNINLSGLLLRADSSQARASLAMTALALKRYGLDRGSYPASLDELVPDYLDAVPVDPFTGKSLEYAVDGEGFLLRSAGEDVKSEAPWERDTVMRWEIPL